MSHADVIKHQALELYSSGFGGRYIANRLNIAPVTVYRWVRASGQDVRTKTEGIELARPRIGQHLVGKKRPPRSAEWRAKISAAKIGKGKGTTTKPRGHIEYTMGQNAGRSVHVVMMEERIGRRLKPDECVHHIDGNPSNNVWENLALMTFAAHSRLHRLQDKLSGKQRTRSKNGRFTLEVKA